MAQVDSFFLLDNYFHNVKFAYLDVNFNYSDNSNPGAKDIAQEFFYFTTYEDLFS